MRVHFPSPAGIAAGTIAAAFHHRRERVKRFVKAVLVVAALAVGAPAMAQGGARTHDGFFIRPELGFGYMNHSASAAGNDVSIYGGAGDFSLAIGGAVKENLILAVHLFGTTISDPDVEVNDTKLSTEDATSSLAGIGPQLTYYFMPVNVYLSGTVALTRLTSEQDGAEGSSDVGVGARFAVGKEWWVSDNWGLGVAGHLGLSSNEDDGERFGTWTSGITFSATFN
jgi:hypothetical protein